MSEGSGVETVTVELTDEQHRFLRGALRVIDDDSLNELLKTAKERPEVYDIPGGDLRDVVIFIKHECPPPEDLPRCIEDGDLVATRRELQAINAYLGGLIAYGIRAIDPVWDDSSAVLEVTRKFGETEFDLVPEEVRDDV